MPTPARQPQRFRAYRAECAGIAVVVWEASPGRARYAVAKAARNGGWIRRADPSQVRVVREPAADHLAAFTPGVCYGYERLPSW